MNPVPPDALKEICSRLSVTLDQDIGAGAFKQAFLVQRGGARFALKVARVSAGNRERFQRESAALRACTHVGIATLHESVIVTVGPDDYWVSVEEYLAHGTLEARLVGGPLDANEVLRLGRLLIEAVGHLSSHRFVHRDIKPANILFRDAATPVLTDFGVVRMLDAPTITADFLMQGPGTPFFAAPEQLRNEKTLIDWRTDQFGLAVVLAFAATGIHPFQPGGTTDPMEAVRAVAARAPLAAAFAARLDGLGLGGLKRSLGVWPHQRYPMPDDMLRAF